MKANYEATSVKQAEHNWDTNLLSGYRVTDAQYPHALLLLLGGHSRASCRAAVGGNWGPLRALTHSHSNLVT